MAWDEEAWKREWLDITREDEVKAAALREWRALGSEEKDAAIWRLREKWIEDDAKAKAAKLDRLGALTEFQRLARWVADHPDFKVLQASEGVHDGEPHYSLRLMAPGSWVEQRRLSLTMQRHDMMAAERERAGSTDEEPPDGEHGPPELQYGWLIPASIGRMATVPHSARAHECPSGSNQPEAARGQPKGTHRT